MKQELLQERAGILDKIDILGKFPNETGLELKRALETKLHYVESQLYNLEKYEQFIAIREQPIL